jgi:hypothetical protein
MIPKTDDELFVAYCERHFNDPNAHIEHRKIITDGIGYQSFVAGVKVEEIKELIREELKDILQRRFKWVVKIQKRLQK